MKKNLIGAILVATACILAFGVTVHHRNRLPLEQKMTLNRIIGAPLLTISKQLNRMGRPEVASAFADLITDNASKSNPGECTCPSSGAGMWNNCLGCLFVMFTKIYNDFTSSLSDLNPDAAISQSVTTNGVTLNVTAEASTISGYDRHVAISNAASNGICLNLHYVKSASDSTKAKAIMQLNSSNCPFASATDLHAMAMKFDLKYTSATLQTAAFFETGNAGGGFDITTATGDAIFTMDITVDESSGSPITTAYILRLAENGAWRVFLRGQDDVLLNIGYDPDDLTSVLTDGTNMSFTCYDDATGATAAGQCGSYGFAGSFPYSPNSIRNITVPTWTTSTSVLNTDTYANGYF